MLKNIIFDFGDIFINLDKEVVYREMEKYGGVAELTLELLALNGAYEIGEISTEEFINALTKVYPNANAHEIINIWNSMILDFPEYRLKFIENLAHENSYRLFLLSNTNELHIAKVIENMGDERYRRFKNCFEQFYLSHEINLRKPNADIYQFVLHKNGLRAEETFFIDDTKENTDSAENIGIRCWNLIPKQDDIINLKNKL